MYVCVCVCVCNWATGQMSRVFTNGDHHHHHHHLA